MNKIWSGVLAGCDTCDGDFGKVMFDAKIPRSSWANLCAGCFRAHGCSLGTGQGQQYVKQANGQWLKVAG